MNGIEVKKINKSYKGFKLKDVSFSLEEGYVMGLIGANGAGKTTLIKSLLTLIIPESGEIKLLDEILTSENTILREKVGFVYDENIYNIGLNIVKQAKLIEPFYPTWSWDDFNRYCDLLKVDKKKKLQKMSKGNQTKVQLILALSHRPKVLIMDEPTTGLDPVIRSKVINIVRELVEKYNTTVLYSTHITSDLENFADYITYLKDGEILFSDEYSNLKESYSIIKGKDISTINKNGIISIKETEFNFCALVDNRYFKQEADAEILHQNTSLQDIMIFFEEESVGV